MTQITVTCGSIGAKNNWWPLVIGGAQFIIGLGLTIYTFRRNFEQKTNERKASWYHKVVVDNAIKLLFSYLDSERKEIENAGTLCEVARSNGNLDPIAIDAVFSDAISAFQERLKPIRSDLTNLALVFDKQLFDQIQKLTLVVDDKVSEWFIEVRNSGIVGVTKPVGETLSEFHRDALHVLRNYEFTVLPKLK
jgi:hypothetical protein